MKKLLKTSIILCMFAFAVMSGFIMSGCNEKDFDIEKISYGESVFVYDGSSHICEITYEDVNVSYSLDKQNYLPKTQIEVKNVGEYTVYFKLSKEGYNDYYGETSVKIKGILASNGSAISSFAKLDEAVSSVENNSTIKLYDDVKLETTIIITKTLTLDLNGHKIYNEQDIYFEDPANNIYNWSLISVRQGGDLIVKGNGKMDAKENDCYDFDVDGGKLTIENGEFIGNICAVYCYSGEVYISGGKFSIKQLNNNNIESAYGQTINIYNKNADNGTVSVEITGGEFNNFDPAGRIDNPHDKLVKDGYTAVLVEGTTYYKVVREN